MIIVSPIIYLYGVVAALILHYEICVYRYINSADLPRKRSHIERTTSNYSFSSVGASTRLVLALSDVYNTPAHNDRH